MPKTKANALLEITQNKIINNFINDLTPCEKRVWDHWYPNAEFLEIVQLRMLRGRHFSIIQGGKVDKPKRSYSYTPAPGGNAA